MTSSDPRDCLFCRIAAGEIPASVVHQDDQLVVFRDINPVAPVHLLLIPRRHVASAAELGTTDGPMLAALFAAAARIARDEPSARDGYRLVTNVGAAAGQTVKHLHFHLLAGRSLAWPPG